jgi:hypothetical protein
LQNAYPNTQPTPFATLQAALERHNSNPHRAPITTISPLDTPYTSSHSQSNPRSRASESPLSSPSASPSPYSRTPAEPDPTTATVGPSTLDDDDDASLAYIPPGETEGLPAPINRAPTFQRQANLLVRAHSRKIFGFGRGSRSSSSKLEAKESRPEVNGPGESKANKVRTQHGNTGGASGGAATKEKIDVERHGGSNPGIDMGLNRRRFRDYEYGDDSEVEGGLSGSTTAASSIYGGTGGILSSLLALYGPQQLHPANKNKVSISLFSPGIMFAHADSSLVTIANGRSRQTKGTQRPS